jgi:lipoic acid synthetase
MSHPAWIRVKAPQGEGFSQTLEILSRLRVHSVCREALCPNQRECFEHRTATFLIGGNLCTRGCRFCGINRQKKPPPPHPDEPFRVAEAIRLLGSRFVVITSVDRDDLEDLGAEHWCQTIREIKRRNPGVFLEALIPDFRGRLELIERIAREKPEIISHNLETTARLYSTVRGGARFEWSLAVLKKISSLGVPAKTGVMVGLGEEPSELFELFQKARSVGVEILTIGQYLRPSIWHHPVVKYYTPEEFHRLKEEALKMGFRVVMSGPFVRSSYHVHVQAEALK